MPPPPRAAQTKATLRQLYKCILPYKKNVPAAACISAMGPYKDGIKAPARAAKKKIRVRRRNMWLILSCHQWILKIFSHSVKWFVNHNGATVKISSYFLGQEESGQFKCGVVSHQCPARQPWFVCGGRYFVPFSSPWFPMLRMSHSSSVIYASFSDFKVY